MGKRKNLLFVHLESISRANLWQFRNELGTVWRLMSMSLQFSRFHAAATSTTMTMNDVMFGDSSATDHYPLYGPAQTSRPDPGVGYRRLDQDFNELGHHWFYFGSTPYEKTREEIWPLGAHLNNPNVPELLEQALRHLGEMQKREAPFAAYFWDDIPHLACPSPLKDRAVGAADRLRTAYALFDDSLNRLLAGLIRLELWDDTIIIGFGDHGDEPWSHGLHRGYCHGTPPHASLTWTPMFIFHPGRFAPAVSDQLASTADLKATALGLLFPELPPPIRRTPFAGIDLFRETRSFAFSQNMFALQREYSDPERGMVKGYAVTDGDYRLVASSGGRKPECGGLELYCDQADPANSLNLLNFFKMGREGELRRFTPPPEAAAGRHFSRLFTPSRVEDIREAHSRLRRELLDFVKAKEEAALREYRRLLDSSAEELAGWSAKENLARRDEDLARRLGEDADGVTPSEFPDVKTNLTASDAAASPSGSPAEPPSPPDPRAPLAVLAAEVAWGKYEDNPWLVQAAAGVGVPLRVMLGLQGLRRISGLDDAAVLAYVRGNPNWLHFCGGLPLFPERPVTPAALADWRASLAAEEWRSLAADFAAWRRRGFELYEPAAVANCLEHYGRRKKIFADLPPPQLFPVAAFFQAARFDDSH